MQKTDFLCFLVKQELFVNVVWMFVWGRVLKLERNSFFPVGNRTVFMSFVCLLFKLNFNFLNPST